MFGSRVHNHSKLFLSCLCAEFHFTHRLHVIASCDCQCQPRNAKSPWERQLRHYSGSIAFHKRGGWPWRAADVAWRPLAHMMQWRVVGCLNMGRANLSMYGIYCRLMTSQHDNMHCILHLLCASFLAASRSKTQTLTAGSVSAVNSSGVQTT